MKNKKGFTLVELLSIITVLGILVMLVVPQIGNNNKATKEKEYNKIKEVIESAAKVYHSSNDEVYLIDIETLIEERYLTTDLTNLINEEKIGGCVRVLKTTDGVFKYKYSESCGNINVAFHADLNHGSTTQQFQTSYIDGTILTLVDPTRSEYSFSHWEVVRGNSYTVDDKLIIGDEDTEIYAMWRRWPILTVDYDGGTPAETLNQKYMSGEIIDLKDPTKEGYTFTGWTIVSGNGILSVNGLTMGSEDTTIKANWEGNNYTINYVLNNGIQGSSHPTTAKHGSVVTISNPTKVGYTFTGWTISGYDTTARHGTSDSNVTNTIASTTTKITSTYFKNLRKTGGAVTLTANFTPNTYTIDYELNGGTHGTSHPTSGTYDSNIIINNPMLNGYTFTGWTISGYDTTARHGTSDSDVTSAIASTSTLIKSTYFKNLRVTSGTVKLTANWRLNNPITSYYCSNGSSGTSPYLINYTGNCTMIDDGNGDWRIKFLSSGTLTLSADIDVDLFVVGGGTAGGNNHGSSAGVGGEIVFLPNKTVTSDTSYTVTVGDASAASAFGSYTASAGGSSYTQGACEFLDVNGSTCVYTDNGYQGHYGASGGQTSYGGGRNASGGDCYGASTTASTAGAANTGAGGGAGNIWNNACYSGEFYYGFGKAGSGGGSGIVIMRNTKSIIYVNNTIIGRYTGKFRVEDDSENWKVRFLTNGTLNMSTAVNADVFIVAGGASGVAYGNGGGAVGIGGEAKLLSNQTLSSGSTHTIVVGGSDASSSFDSTTAATGASTSATGVCEFLESSNGTCTDTSHGYQGRYGASGGQTSYGGGRNAVGGDCYGASSTSSTAGAAETGAGGGAGNLWNNACTDGQGYWYGFGHPASSGGTGTVIIRKAK